MGSEYPVIVVGGGFFGCVLARHLARERHHRVLLVEADHDLMQKASHANQARVHNGYHYPRSLVTAARSRTNYARFCHEFRDCIRDDVDMYYAIARRFSQVDAAQFERFCQRIGAPLWPASSIVASLFDDRLVEAVFRVEEAVFDADALRDRLRSDLIDAGVHIETNTRARRVRPTGSVGLSVELESPSGTVLVRANQLYNCTYSSLNHVVGPARDEPALPLKHEWTELCLVSVPPALEGIGVTVMCGPFFSLLPFPGAGLHSLSHVRYTPHGYWHEGPTRGEDPLVSAQTFRRRSKFVHMVADARRYLPALSDCVYRRSLWTVKTLLPRNEIDDGRPILCRSRPDISGMYDVMGGKLDNVYDALAFIDHTVAP